MVALQENLRTGTQYMFLLRTHIIFSLNVDIFNVPGKTAHALCIVLDLSRHLDKFQSASPHTPVWEQKKRSEEETRAWRWIEIMLRPKQSRWNIYIFEVNFFLKLLFCTLICSFCPCSAPHAPDLVINFLSRVQQFIGLSLQSRNWSHTYPDKTVLMSLKPGAEGLDELILQP